MKTFCVISHTHWDREWYMPFEQFRLRLVDLIDRLLDVVGEYPDFIFHLDAQTVVLEDYLEIRPSKKEELNKYIKNGNILVGPWYLQNDFFLTSGEATIRNLLEGERLASEFGKCMMVGYAPDQFGIISQLPQILNGFGINDAIFGRGFGRCYVDENGLPKKEDVPTEIIWKSPDGSEVFAVYMRFWYNNAQRFSENIDKAYRMVKNIENCYKDCSAVPYVLMMNGVDHLEPQENLPPILEKLCSRLEGAEIKQYSMEKYTADCKKYIKDNNIELKTYTGEFRQGSDWEILKGTLSSRHYLKIENVKAQNILECILEPLYSMFELWGAEGSYPSEHFRYMWKSLMKNHPHDSICGCSRDEIHEHMEDNYKRLGEVTSMMLDRVLDNIAGHLNIGSDDNNDGTICVLNTTELERTELVRTKIYFHKDDNIKAFKIYDNEGKNIEYRIIDAASKKKDIFSPINLPATIEIAEYTVEFLAEKVKPFSAKYYLAKRSDDDSCLRTAENDSMVLDNGLLRVEINTDGKIDITDVKNGFAVKNALYVEETCDCGDSYVYRQEDKLSFYSFDFKPEISMLQNNAYQASYEILYPFVVPEYFDFNLMKRSREKVCCPVKLTLTLKKGSEVLEVKYSVDNKAKDHRIRLMIDTGITSCISKADTPFDIIEREQNEKLATYSDVYPNTSFAAIENNENGVAVFTEGAHEYEHLKDNKSVLAFTVLRATGVISRNVDLSFGNGEQWLVPGNQCLRKIEGHIGIYTYATKTDSESLILKAKQFRNPLISSYKLFDRTKEIKRNFAVQDTDINEVFCRADKYASVRIENCAPVFKIDGFKAAVTAFKKSFDEKGFILRLFNYTDEIKTSVLSIKGSVYRTQLNETNDIFLGTDKLELQLRPKEILTLKIFS